MARAFWSHLLCRQSRSACPCVLTATFSRQAVRLSRAAVKGRSLDTTVPPINAYETHPNEAEVTGESSAVKSEVDEAQVERTALVKEILSPAYSHGRKRVDAPPGPEAERMSELSKLLSGRQIKVHASRLVDDKHDKKPKQKEGLNAKASKTIRHQATTDDDEDEKAAEESDQDVLKLQNSEQDAGQMLDTTRKAAYATLTPRWSSGIASPPEVLSYLATRAVANYAVNLRVLRELQWFIDQQQRCIAARTPAQVQVSGVNDAQASKAVPSLLDVGLGPGGGILAAKSIWPKIHRVEGLDHSAAMRDLARHLLDDPKLIIHRHLPQLAAQVDRSQQPYDIVFSSYTLSELASDLSRALAVELMWKMVADDGHLLLVEEGNPEGSRIVRSARKLILQGRGCAYTVAPCPHDRPCPLPRSATCRFSQRVPAGSVRRGVIGSRKQGYKDVGFSYVIMRKSKAPAESDALSDERMQLLYKLRLDPDADEGSEATPEITEQDWETAEEGVLERSQWGRLIMPPRKAKRHVHLDLCTPAGSLDRLTVTKGNSSELQGKYLSARRAQWGGLWPMADF